MNGIYVQRLAEERYLRAPLLKEREAFLQHRLSIGINRRAVRMTSATLLHVVRILKLKEPRAVTSDEVLAGGRAWAADAEFHRHKQAGPNSSRVFTTAAFLFLVHAGLLTSKLQCEPFGTELQLYGRMLEEQRGLQANTVAGLKGNLLRFFRWLGQRSATLQAIKTADVLEYLHERSGRSSEAYVAIIAGALRSFFTYAAEQAWLERSIVDVLEERCPGVAKVKPVVTLPWQTVLGLINSANGKDGSTIRAKAVMLLCAVYGFRASEVAALKLCDLDWVERTISVRRSKSGIWQCMPLRSEVGKALKLYIEAVRPPSSCRQVFVTLQRPHRAMKGANIGLVVRRRMLDMGMCSTKLGPHTLRHACATQLLASGSSLREIADFLGHRDFKSVSIYACCDDEALRQIAAFSIADVTCK